MKASVPPGESGIIGKSDIASLKRIQDELTEDAQKVDFITYGRAI